MTDARFANEWVADEHAKLPAEERRFYDETVDMLRSGRLPQSIIQALGAELDMAFIEAQSSDATSDQTRVSLFLHRFFGSNYLPVFHTEEHMSKLISALDPERWGDRRHTLWCDFSVTAMRMVSDRSRGSLDVFEALYPNYRSYQEGVIPQLQYADDQRRASSELNEATRLLHKALWKQVEFYDKSEDRKHRPKEEVLAELEQVVARYPFLKETDWRQAFEEQWAESQRLMAEFEKRLAERQRLMAEGEGGS